MTASERMMKLMAYIDGELEGAERAEIEKLLETDAEAMKIVNQMASLGEVVKAIQPKAPDIDLTDAIMAKVENEKIDAPPAKVVSISAAKKRRNVGVAVVAALALAASVVVMTRQKDEAPLARAPQNPPAETNQVNQSSGPGVEVEAVESPGHSVSVFYLPTTNEMSTSVVVWVDETGDKK